MASGTSDSCEPARVLLVLYTFHPNLEGLIVGLAQANHPVRVLVMEQARVQIGAVGPEGTRTVSESFACRAHSAIRRILRRRPLYMWEKTPSFTGMWREFREYKPGIVIVRSNQLGILGSFVLARLMRAKFVVYNLRPLEWPPRLTCITTSSRVICISWRSSES